MAYAFIGIGSNIEPRLNYILNALRELKNYVNIVKISNIYETEPWGNPNLLTFYNAVAKIETSLSPEQLLKLLLKIENQYGRTRNQKWDNRTLDLDLLDYEGVICNETYLMLPHPFIQERSFVVIPWYDIEKEWILANNLKINDLYFNFFSSIILKSVQKSPDI